MIIYQLLISELTSYKTKVIGFFSTILFQIEQDDRATCNSMNLLLKFHLFRRRYKSSRKFFKQFQKKNLFIFSYDAKYTFTNTMSRQSIHATNTESTQPGNIPSNNAAKFHQNSFHLTPLLTKAGSKNGKKKVESSSRQHPGIR